MRTARWMLCLALLALPLAATAQTDAERIAATMDALLAAAQASDAEAVADLITDPFVARTDPFDAVQTREEFLESLAGRPTPAECSLGDFEPWIGQGGAYALVPFYLGPEKPSVIGEVHLATLFVEAEGEWKVAAMVMLVTLDEEDPNAAPVRDLQPRMMAQLQEFAGRMQGLAANASMAAFAELCHEDAVLGAVSEATGAMELATAEEAHNALAGEGLTSGLSPSGDAEMVFEAGFGTVLVATNMDLLQPDGTTETRRHVGILAYLPTEGGEGEWLAVAALQVPLPE